MSAKSTFRTCPTTGLKVDRDAENLIKVNAVAAVVFAAQHRLRPILLTASAAILGMIPIMSDVFWGPMAYVVIGGLAGVSREPWWAQSLFAPPLESVVIATKPWLPDVVAEKIRFR